MSEVKFFPGNYITADATEYTANSEDAFYPTSNLKDIRSTKEFRTAQGTSSLTLVIDLKTTEDIDALLVQGGLFNGFGFTGSLTLEANSANDFTSPPFTTTLTPSTEYNYGIKTFATQSYRYWRISASSSGDYVALQNIYLGKSLEITTNSIEYGWELRSRDQSRVTKNKYGQPFIDDIAVQRTLRASFTLLNKDELTSLDDMFRVAKTTKPIWFQVFDTESTTVVNDGELFLLHGRLRRQPSYRNSNFGLFESGFELEEIL